MSERHWNVSDGKQPILEISDRPGPIVSTAPLPPGARPVMHPFLSARALDAFHEDKLRQLLVASKNLPEFLTALRAAGYEVRPIGP